MAVNTYNESKLHLALKKIYAMESNGNIEVKLDDTEWICDIIDENGNAIEIQTSNLNALQDKVEYLLSKGRKVTVVHPVLEEKTIEMLDEDGNRIYRKKSPKRATFYDSLRGMTKIAPLFMEKDCTLEVLYVKAVETRVQTEEAVQNETKSRRRLKNWLQTEKSLEEIKRKKRFSERKDFLELLCDYAPGAEKSGETFRLCDLQAAIKKAHGVKTARWASLTIWILLKMNLIKVSETRGRSKFYSLADSDSLSSVSLR